MAAAGFLVASGNNIRPDVSDAKIGSLQRGRAREANLQREAALESGDAINSPSETMRSPIPVKLDAYALPCPKGDRDIADHKPL